LERAGYTLSELMSVVALFVRSASPGAVLRFLERRKGDPERPDEILLSEAVGEKNWRALFAPPGYLEAIAGPLSTVFPDEVMIAVRDEKTLLVFTYKEGKLAETKNSLEGHKSIWGRLMGFNSLATLPPVWHWAKEKGLPLHYLKKPPRIIDYSTVAILDQRKLLVEDSPRLYRFPLC
jgi:hypothetical protein